MIGLRAGTYLSLGDEGDLLYFVEVTQNHVVRVVESRLHSAQEGDHHVGVLAIFPRVGLDASPGANCLFVLGDAEVAAEPVEEGLE